MPYKVDRATQLKIDFYIKIQKKKKKKKKRKERKRQKRNCKKDSRRSDIDLSRWEY